MKKTGNILEQGSAVADKLMEQIIGGVSEAKMSKEMEAMDKMVDVVRSILDTADALKKAEAKNDMKKLVGALQSLKSDVTEALGRI